MKKPLFFSALFAAAVLLQAGCSLPRIIILHDPLSAEEHDRLGRIYESQGKQDLALQQYQAALKKDPGHVPSLLLLGDLSYVRGDWNGAEAAYRKAIKLTPENGDIYNNLAWVRLKQEGDLKEAEALIAKALTLTPDHRSYYLDTLGVILLKQARPWEAVAALKESADSLSKDKPELLAETYTHLAEAYRAAGDPVHADEAAAAAKKYSDMKN